MSTCNVISVSGGKDSTAMILLSIERQVENPIYLFADTGHEHLKTYEYVEYLEHALGITINRVRADFSQKIAEKKASLKKHLMDLDNMGRGNRRLKGFTAPMLERMIDAMEPTGNPFLDLCIWKGRFPSTRARFCSQELKHEPLDEFMRPLFKQYGTVISWQGVRADESLNRRHLPMYDVEVGQWEPEPKGWLIYRPIIDWTAQDVFAQHRKSGVKWNPIYEHGMSRVGCMPCIHAKKSELMAIFREFPEEIERVAEWERIVSKASKRGTSSFFSADTIAGNTTKGADVSLDTHGISSVMEWAKTSRGGRQYDLINAINVDDQPQCTSVYGLCE